MGAEEFCMDDSSSQGSSPLSFLGDLHELPENTEISYQANNHRQTGNPSVSNLDSVARSNRYSSSSQSEAEDSGQRLQQEEFHFRRNSLGSQSSSTLTSKSSHDNLAAESLAQTLTNQDVFYNLDSQSTDSGSVHVPAEVDTSQELESGNSGSLAYDPEQIAKMVLAEVGREKHAVESMQKVNLMKSQQTSFMLRRQYSDTSSTGDSQSSQKGDNKVQTAEKSSAFKTVPAVTGQTSASHAPLCRASPSGLPRSPKPGFHTRQDSGQGKSCTTSGSESDREPESYGANPTFTSLQPTGQCNNNSSGGTSRKVPPPVPSKPLPRNLLPPEPHRKPAQSGGDPRRKVYDTSVDSTDSGIVDDRAPSHSAAVTQVDSGGKPSLPAAPPPPLQSRPPPGTVPYQLAPRDPAPLRVGRAGKPFPHHLSPQLRPESSASTSSQCSTTSSSSVQTVIYRPPDRNSRASLPPPPPAPGQAGSAQTRLNASRVRFYPDAGYTSSDTEGSVSYRDTSAQRHSQSHRHSMGSIDSSDAESVDSYSDRRSSHKQQQQQQRRYSYHPDDHKRSATDQWTVSQDGRAMYHFPAARENNSHPDLTTGPPPYTPPQSYSSTRNSNSAPRANSQGSYRQAPESDQNLGIYREKPVIRHDPRFNSQTDLAPRGTYKSHSHDQPQGQCPSYNGQVDQSKAWQRDVPPPMYRSDSRPGMADHRTGQPRESIQLQTMYTERARKALPKGAVLQSSKC